MIGPPPGLSDQHRCSQARREEREYVGAIPAVPCSQALQFPDDVRVRQSKAGIFASSDRDPETALGVGSNGVQLLSLA